MERLAMKSEMGRRQHHFGAMWLSKHPIPTSIARAPWPKRLESLMPVGYGKWAVIRSLARTIQSTSRVLQKLGKKRIIDRPFLLKSIDVRMSPRG